MYLCKVLYSATIRKGYKHIAGHIYIRGITERFGFDDVRTSQLQTVSHENPDCSSLFNTILHESRHAFQHKAVLNPDSVSIDNNRIDTWRQNFENYISPWLDYEAYREQPVEADAFDYADNMVPENSDGQLLAQANEEQEDQERELLLNNELLDQPLV